MASTERERASCPQKRRKTRKKAGRDTVNIRAGSIVKEEEWMVKNGKCREGEK